MAYLYRKKSVEIGIPNHPSFRYRYDAWGINESRLVLSPRISRSVAQDITKKRTSLRLMEAERDLSNPVKGAGKAGGKAGKAGK